MARMPTTGGDNGTWGTELNTFLDVAHQADGTLDPAEATLAGKVGASTVTTKGDILAATASATVARHAVGANGTSLVADSTQSDGLTWNTIPSWYPLYKSGFYYFCNSPSNNGTSAALGNNTLRATPFVVAKSVSITRLGADFTVAGDAASILRLGIHNDDGTGVPGTVALDAGSISTGSGNAGTVATGGTPGAYEITVSVTLAPGLYWASAVVQGAPGTQPTVRIAGNTSMIAPIPWSTIPTAGTTSYALSHTGSVSGALVTWSGTSIVSSAPRLFFKVA